MLPVFVVFKISGDKVISLVQIGMSEQYVRRLSPYSVYVFEVSEFVVALLHTESEESWTAPYCADSSSPFCLQWFIATER
jgi:hypothetical protein